MNAINLINHNKIRSNPSIIGICVELSNIFVGMRVKQGFQWRAKWRDNIDTTSTTNPKKRLGGVIIGYVNENNMLVGQNTMRKYETDKITHKNGPGWAVVRWDNHIESIYPIGAENVYSLQIENAEKYISSYL